MIRLVVFICYYHNITKLNVDNSINDGCRNLESLKGKLKVEAVYVD